MPDWLRRFHQLHARNPTTGITLKGFEERSKAFVRGEVNYIFDRSGDCVHHLNPWFACVRRRSSVWTIRVKRQPGH